MKYEQIMRKSGIDYLKLNITAPYAQIMKEIYSSKFNIKQQNRFGWYGMAVRGIDKDKPRPHTFYGYKSEAEVPYKWTEISDECPSIRKFIEKNIPCNKFYRVKINIIKPKGIIPIHNDSRTSGLGLTEHYPYKDSEAFDVQYITIVLDWPNKNPFFLGNKKIPIENGNVFIIDFSKNHVLINASNRNCYSIVVSAHVKGNKEWEKLIKESYSKNKLIRTKPLSLLDLILYAIALIPNIRKVIDVIGERLFRKK